MLYSAPRKHDNFSRLHGIGVGTRNDILVKLVLTKRKDVTERTSSERNISGIKIISVESGVVRNI